MHFQIKGYVKSLREILRQFNFWLCRLLEKNSEYKGF